MRPSLTPRVKICCISSVREAWLAIKHGASALGLVSEMPSGAGVISEVLIAQIASVLPPGVASVLLTSKQHADEIVEQLDRCPVDVVQIVDRLKQGTYDDIRARVRGITIMQVIHVNGKEAVAEAERVAPDVDAILLDSGNPTLPTKELGGTGRTHDWRLSKEIRKRVAVPIYLAGGLRPENVGQAIAQVRPFGVDVCTGVRKDDILNESRLEAFFQQVGRAGQTPAYQTRFRK